MSGLRIFLQGLREVKPKQSCIIGCQIILTPTSYNTIILYYQLFNKCKIVQINSNSFAKYSGRESLCIPENQNLYLGGSINLSSSSNITTLFLSFVTSPIQTASIPALLIASVSSSPLSVASR